MAQDYVILNKDNPDNGLIAINKSVFQSIAEISIDDIENAGKSEATRFSRPVVVKIADNRLMIDADIHIRYGANVNATCELVQNKIYENILFMTGFHVSDISVTVSGFEI